MAPLSTWSMARHLASRTIAFILITQMHGYAFIWEPANRIGLVQFDNPQSMANSLSQRVQINDSFKASSLRDMKPQNCTTTNEPQRVMDHPDGRTSTTHSHETMQDYDSNQDSHSVVKSATGSRPVDDEIVERQLQQPPFVSENKTPRTETRVADEKNVTTKVKFKLNQESRTGEEDDLPTRDVPIQAKQVRPQEQMPARPTERPEHFVVKRASPTEPDDHGDRAEMVFGEEEEDTTANELETTLL